MLKNNEMTGKLAFQQQPKTFQTKNIKYVFRFFRCNVPLNFFPPIALSVLIFLFQMTRKDKK